MAQRILLLLTARSASSFLGYLLTGKNYLQTGEKVSNPNTLKVTPRLLHYNENWPHGHLINDYIMKTSNPGVSELYSFYVGVHWGKAFCDRLPRNDNNWRFLYVLRDPRNWIESHLKWATKESGHRPTKEIFEEKCNSIRTKTKGLLSMKGDERLRIVYFEDLVNDPLDEFSKMMKFAGNFSIDKDHYQQIINRWYNRSNSSFGDKGQGANKRWVYWSQDLKTKFKDLAGNELIQLGYEKNNDW